MNCKGDIDRSRQSGREVWRVKQSTSYDKKKVRESHSKPGFLQDFKSNKQIFSGKTRITYKHTNTQRRLFIERRLGSWMGLKGRRVEEEEGESLGQELREEEGKKRREKVGSGIKRKRVEEEEGGSWVRD